MIRSKIQQFMYGRNGADQLSTATLWCALILWLVFSFTQWVALYALSMALMVYTLFRIFSRQLEKRRVENTGFLNAIRPLQQKYARLHARLRDKNHRYFRCPNCKQQMRVPRGKGRIQVTCRNCGITFEEKS